MIFPLSGSSTKFFGNLAIALAYKACEEGYKVSYTTMQSLMQTLRTHEIDRRSKAKMNRIQKSNLLVVDEVGYLPLLLQKVIYSFS